MKFREHRGALEDSMQTVREVNSLEDVSRILLVKSEYMVCQYYCYDARIDWDTWIIICFTGEVLGFSNGELE